MGLVFFQCVIYFACCTETYSKHLVPKELLAVEQLHQLSCKQGIGWKREELFFIANHHWAWRSFTEWNSICKLKAQASCFASFVRWLCRAYHPGITLYCFSPSGKRATFPSLVVFSIRKSKFRVCFKLLKPTANT